MPHPYIGTNLAANLFTMKKQSSIFGVLLALVPVLSAGQSDPFRAIDRNGDGFISSEEWYGQKLAPVPFTVVDLDGDGRISESEFREWSSARGGSRAVGMAPADRFRTIDKNKDGVISPEEWKDGSYSRTPFSAVDGNKDGTISLREFSAWDQRRAGPAAPALPPGTSAPAMSERMRSLDRGAAGGAVSPIVQPAPRAASSPTPAPLSPATTTPSGGIPGSSPNMSSGSGLTTK
jgi:Ca2+-binding EF-hand superfamily protein